MVATLGASSVTFGEIVNMKVGDIIPLTIDENIIATVDGVPIIESRYGIQNGQYALKIGRFLAEKDA